MKRILLLPALFLFVGCSHLVTPVYQPGTTNVVQYIPSAPLTNALGIGQQVAPLVPPPFGEIASGVLALATAGLGVYARIKTNQLSDHQSMLSAVIAGVEKAGTPATKDAIAQNAAVAGVGGELDAAVRQVTSQLPKTS
jgi:hypothetical protein